MKAIDVLKTLDNLFLDCHYPLRHVVLNPSKDVNYTVGNLVEDTLKEDAVLTNAMHSDGEGRTVLEKSSIPGDEETFNNGVGW